MQTVFLENSQAVREREICSILTCIVKAAGRYLRVRGTLFIYIIGDIKQKIK